ncbi:MAG: BMP family ABC transporter substrate-binding protein [Spirochaetales bacterium]|nr:BMP family ABC transporter substrate-binding protein [Spirochaetales bacterium]
MKRLKTAAAIVAVLLLLSSCGPAAPYDSLKVGVFVPGVASGSPIYEMLVEGACRAVEATPGAALTVVEAGFNQAEWLDKLSAMAGSGKFGLIVTSNPALPELCAVVAEQYPRARFLVADAWLEGNDAIHTVLYNQLEQGYLAGYLAGLVTTGGAPGSNPEKKVGLVIAQTYPTLDKLIEPGFRAGLKAVDPAIELETRVVGNWFDAAKAGELAKGLFDAGVDIILPIAGGANQGVLSVAAESGRRVVLLESGTGVAYDPEVVVGSAWIAQDRLVEEKVKALLGGVEGLYGTAELRGFAEGYIGFADEAPWFLALPAATRERFTAAEKALAEGEPAFPVTGF